MSSVLNEVVRPDMILPTWTKSHAGTIVQPEPSPFGLLLWYFQPLPSPDSLNTLVIDAPAFCPQQTGNAPVTITTILTGQPDDVRRQGIFIGSASWFLALSGSVLTEDMASPAFTNTELADDLINTSPATVGA